ncbi:hypothetical protein Q9L58_010630 [Maublancomyces gigas]|uniref:HNH nuclease domain-containing protein n=1 Tax=Discina gigas TaxID=1032678 RepID=A0ABR3G3K2_9PEZI
MAMLPPLPSPLSPTSSSLIWVLPDPLYTENPQLYSHLTRGIQSKFGLTSPERSVLRAVLKHIPIGSSPDRSTAVTTLVDRILSLDPPRIKRLAEIFTNGLLDARSWGGTRKSVCSRAISLDSIDNSAPDTLESRMETPVLDESYSDIFQRLAISPFPDQRVIVDPESVEKKPTRRTAKHSRACLERQNSSCPLTTQSDIGLETAHLIPHSVAALKKSETSFWLLVAIYLGPDLRDRLYDIIRGADSYSTTNGLVLGCVMHKFFDKGVFYLIPRPTPDFDTQTSHYLDVCFQWKYSPDNLALCFTRLPPLPENQTTITSAGSITPALAPQARQIQDGDVFRLFTGDPARLPLPHPFLLSLHAALWEIIGCAGLGETGQDKRKRLRRPTPAAAAHGDSDDSADDANATARKRNKRGSKKDRKTKDMPKPAPAPAEQPSIGGPSTQASNHLNLGPSVPRTPVANAMTFLEREYLDFKLRQVVAGDVGFELETDDDDDDSCSVISDGLGKEFDAAGESSTDGSSSSGDYLSDEDEEEEPDSNTVMRQKFDEGRVGLTHESTGIGDGQHL